VIWAIGEIRTIANTLESTQSTFRPLDDMTSESTSSNTEYEFEPFEEIFVRRREQILKLVWVTGAALRQMNGAARLTDVLGKPPESVEKMQELEDLAADEVAADLPLLHSAASVLIWGALEAAFHDFLVRWLFAYPAARLVPEFTNIRVRITEYESFEGEDKMRYLAGILERELAAALKPGAGRFECLLKPFGIRPQVAEDQRRDLSELAAVRNVIVHRAGIADARLLQLCPWLKLKVGDPVVVGRETFLRYVDAASSYAASLIESARLASKAFKAPDAAAQPIIPPDLAHEATQGR
jgi:hypothetical protein